MSIMVIDAIYSADPLSPIADRFVGKKINNDAMMPIKGRDWSGTAILQEDVVVKSTEKSGVKQTLNYSKGCPVFFHYVRLITLEEAEQIKEGKRLK